MGKERPETRDLVFLAVITLLAVIVRLSVRSFVSEDWSVYWSSWLSELSGRGFATLADDFYDYAPPVMYLLYLITLLPINAMTAFKGFCCALEFAAALLLMRMVHTYTGSRRRAYLTYAVFLFLPTVILNASVWAQCDIIYTLLILCSVYFLTKGKSWTGMWFYGAAFAVKLQTLFVFPFLVLLWVRRKIELRQFLTIPAAYLLGILPAWLAGRPFSELLGIYAFQGGKDRWSLSIKFPNIYQIIGNNFFLDEYVSAGMYLILGILMLAMFYLAYRRVRVTDEYVLLLVLFFGLLTTYFLPHMHERYLYLTDALLLVYVMLRPRRVPLFLAAAFVTVVGYAQYLTKNEPTVAYGVLAFVELGILVRIGLDLRQYVHAPEHLALTDEPGGSRLDEWLRALLFRRFTFGYLSFDFLEALLAVCVTGVGLLLRTPFESGFPHWSGLLTEWMLAVTSAALLRRLGASRKRTLAAYGILFILPCVIADGTILGGDASVGALLLICALLFLEGGNAWLFTLAGAALMLLSVRYIALLPVCAVLWQRGRLRREQLFILTAAGAARFLYAYRAWFAAGYSLVTFQWPNIYEIVGTASVQGQQTDPLSLVGFFLTLGLLAMLLWMLAQGNPAVDGAAILRLLLFFGLTAGYFLPYMDVSYGYLFAVLAGLYGLLVPRDFWIPLLLQIVVYAGYQERLNGESMMPMAVFAVLQFLILSELGVRILQEAGVCRLWERKN